MTDKTPSKIQKMFNDIASRYDFLNDLISLGLQKNVKLNAFKSLKIRPNDEVLDLCTGTGDIAHILKKIQPKANVTGLDFSKNMLRIAKKRFQDEIDFIYGDVCDLPFEDNRFDIITISFGLRNIQDRKRALKEIKRVLKNDGCFAHLDFARQNPIFDFLFDKITIFFSKIFSKRSNAYKYLIDSKNEFKNTKDLIKEFEDEGFKYISKKSFLFGTLAVTIFRNKNM